MPRHFLSLPAILATSLVVTATANAVEKNHYHCQSGDLVRRIVIEVGDLSTSLPCEVVYWKDNEAPGVRRVLWNARSDARYCDDKASGLVEKLSSSGWQCDIRGAVAPTTEAAVQPQPAAPQGVDQALNSTVPAVDAATVANQNPTVNQAASLNSSAPTLPTEQALPGLPAAQAPQTQTAELTPPSTPLPPEADGQLQAVIAQNLTSLNQQVDGDFEAEVGHFGDLNADGMDDAVVLFNYQSSAQDFTQFVAAYLYKGDDFHLAATKPVGGTERAVQKVEIESIVNGSIVLKLHLNDASQAEGRRAAMTLKDGQLIEIE